MKATLPLVFVVATSWGCSGASGRSDAGPPSSAEASDTATSSSTATETSTATGTDVATAPTIDPAVEKAFAAREAFALTQVGALDNRRPLPVIDLARDPSTYVIPAFTPGRGRPQLPTSPGAIAVVMPPRWAPFPECPTPLPKREIAQGLAWQVDGDLGEWGMRGLIAHDVDNDGVRGQASLDIRYLWMGESEDDYYLAVRLGSAWSHDLTGNTVLRLTLTGDGGVHKLDLRAGALGRLSGSTFQAFADADHDVAVSGSALEIRFAKDLVASLGTLTKVEATVMDRTPTSGQTSSDHVGFVLSRATNERYTCQIRRPTGRLLNVRLKVERDADEIAAERTMRAVLIAIPEVDHVLQDQLASDAFDIVVRNSGPTGLCCNSAPQSIMWINDAPQRDSVTELFVATHEYGHAYNGFTYGLPSLLVEPHSDFASQLAHGSYWGPLAGYQSIQSRAVAVLRREQETGLAWNVLTTPGSKQILLLHLVARKIGVAPLREILRKRTDAGRWKDVAGFLAAVAASPAFGGASETWNGWANTDASYAGSNFPLTLTTDSDGDGLVDVGEVERKTDKGQPDTDADGLSDAFEVAYGLDPTTPSMASLKGLAADGELGDWDHFLPGALVDLAAPVSLPTGCPSSMVIKRVGAANDGAFLLAAAELTETPGPDAAMRLRVDVMGPDDAGARVLVARDSREVLVQSPSGKKKLFSYDHIRPFAAATVEVPIHVARLAAPVEQVRIVTEVKVGKDKWTPCHATTPFAPTKTR